MKSEFKIMKESQDILKANIETMKEENRKIAEVSIGDEKKIEGLQKSYKTIEALTLTLTHLTLTLTPHTHITFNIEDFLEKEKFK